MSEERTSSASSAAAARQCGPRPNHAAIPARIVFGSVETARRHLAVYAARAFQAERDSVLASLPLPYKGRWGKWFVLNEGRQPYCYVLSPYHVPPGPHRTRWMEWFEQVRANNTTKECGAANSNIY
jgi:hypothetical protein